MKFLLQLLTTLVLAAGINVNQAVAEPEEVFMGSVAMDVPIAMIKRLTPLTQYLSEKTGLKVSFRASPNLGSAANELGSNFIQIAYLTPVAYLEAHDKHNARPLVAPLTHGKSTFNLVVVVRQDSPAKTMQDLRGKSFAFGDEKAILQRAVVTGAGIKREEFSQFAFLNHYDNIAKAVLNKDFDAGILKDTIASEFESKGLRVIYVSPPLPSYVFAVSSKLPEATADKLRDALLELKAGTPEHKSILKELDQGYDGFTEAKDKDYDVIRKLVAPFK